MRNVSHFASQLRALLIDVGNQLCRAHNQADRSSGEANRKSKSDQVKAMIKICGHPN